MSSSATYPKGQVYFLSHGGPPTMFETTSAPYKAWQKYGQAVAEQNPRGLVVVSAHWESDNDQILGKFACRAAAPTPSPLVIIQYSRAVSEGAATAAS